GIRRTWLERATYRREVHVPDDWAGARVVLCFGAVHHRAVVTIDGRTVGEHVGGQNSFEFDITDSAAAGARVTVEVAVEAPADKRAIPHGKQRSIPRDDYDGVAFTPTSGIWQPVWLEARGRTYLESIAVRGDSLTSFAITGRLAGDAPAGALVTVALGTGEEVELVADADRRIDGLIAPRDARLWSPTDPQLHRLTFTVGGGEAADRVIVTGGLRRFEAKGEELHLNGERVYLRGVLDQGYWPGTGLTAPDDDALVRDLELARELGFNLVRKHLKLEEPLWLHRADQMGMLVWAEPPAPSRFSEDAAAAFEAQLQPMVERDGSHPSIVVWGLYNEEWGLDWDIPGSPERSAAAAHAYDALAALDRSRPIVENSGWNHIRTDLVDWHYYEPDPAEWARALAAMAAGEQEEFPVRLGPDFTVDKSMYGDASFPRTGVPILNSEYGEGFTSLERAWHSRWQTQELRRHDRFAGYVYTELCDVEHEMAGLLDADRRPKDWGGLVPAQVHADTVLVLDLVPARAGADIAVPTSPLPLSVHVSHHGRTPLRVRIRAAWTTVGRPADVPEPAPAASSEEVEVQPFALSDAAVVTVPPPGPVGTARLLVWAVDEAGATVARTFVDAAEIEPLNRRGARVSADADSERGSRLLPT
ncbi:MAG TPA: sugar-binding domain-containing protein, partial [Naasia sp.]